MVLFSVKWGILLNSQITIGYKEEQEQQKQGRVRREREKPESDSTSISMLLAGEPEVPFPKFAPKQGVG